MNIFMLSFFSSAFGDAEAAGEAEPGDDAGSLFPEQPATTTLDIKTAETTAVIVFLFFIDRHAPF
jgi:hypothetical protein